MDVSITFHMINVMAIYLTQMRLALNVVFNIILYISTLLLYDFAGTLYIVISVLLAIDAGLIITFLIRHFKNTHKDMWKYYLKHKFDWIDFSIGLGLIIIGIVGLCVQTVDNYWRVYSILWHMPIMMSTYFIYEIYDPSTFMLFFKKCA